MTDSTLDSKLLAKQTKVDTNLEVAIGDRLLLLREVGIGLFSYTGKVGKEQCSAVECTQ